MIGALIGCGLAAVGRAATEVGLVLHGILSKAVSLLGEEWRVVRFLERKGCHDVECIMNIVHAKFGPFTGDSRRKRGADLIRYE